MVSVRLARVRIRFFPLTNVRWLVLALTINVLLWLDMLYAINNAEDYTKNRGSYLTRTWMIIAVPLAVMILLLLYPHLGSGGAFKANIWSWTKGMLSWSPDILLDRVS